MSHEKCLFGVLGFCVFLKVIACKKLNKNELKSLEGIT
jgi:hypothetical protein